MHPDDRFGGAVVGNLRVGVLSMHKLPSVKTAGDGVGEEGGLPQLPRLPPGRHGLPREFVVQNQRERLAAGMIAAIAERGYHATTISDIAAAAGVSRRTFYGYFKTKEDCFADTYESVAGFLFSAMAEAGEGERGWAAQVHARLGALLEVFAANPDLVRFTLAVPPAAGGAVAARYREVLDRLLATLAEGRPKSVRRPTEAAEHGIAGGLAALLVDRVEAGEGERLPELLPDLVELALTPYIGRDRAVAEASRE
jgi:AcrR family transcriptional regulator